MDFDSSIPIFRQITDVFRVKIISGKMRLGERVPAVRELAAEYVVNPNTMQRALALLEQEGLLYTERTSGRFVTENADVIERAKAEMLDAEVSGFLSRMASMGYSGEDIFAALKDKGETV